MCVGSRPALFWDVVTSGEAGTSSTQRISHQSMASSARLGSTSECVALLTPSRAATRSKIALCPRCQGRIVGLTTPLVLRRVHSPLISSLSLSRVILPFFVSMIVPSSASLLRARSGLSHRPYSSSRNRRRVLCLRSSIEQCSTNRRLMGRKHRVSR